MAKKRNETLPVIHRGGGFFETFGHLQDKIRERAHAIFNSRDSHDGNQVSDWLKAESEVLTSIALSFGEEDGRYVLRGELPGFAPDEVDIHIDGNILTVGGCHKTEVKKKTKSGQATASSEINFFRRVSMPNDADADHIAATFKSGVLEVTLPKAGTAS